MDTLRADHLGLYGYPRVTSPELDVRASSAVVFERARSQAACTFPSINSIFTSRYAIEFAERGFRNFVIPEELPTLAETLRTAGLATFAVS
ncbi:MAG: sulfatase-like hydrolase/transferase, partial [bacterium]